MSTDQPGPRSPDLPPRWEPQGLFHEWLRALGPHGPWVVAVLGIVAAFATSPALGVVVVIVMAGAGAPLLAQHRPGWRKPAAIFKALCALLLLLAGLALTAASIFLFIAGSYGILAALMLAPIGVTLTVVGGSLLFSPSIPED